MRRVSTVLLAALLLASACGPLPVAKDVKKKGATSTPASVKPRASAGASAGPSAAAGGTQPAGDPARLRVAANTVPLGGSVLLDASYMVAAGAGNILSHNGGQIVAAGGGNVIVNNGGTLVAAGGLNLVAAGGLNMVAAGAGNLVAAGGGNLVAAGAGNIVAAGGGNMVAAGAGNLVAAGAGNLIGPDGASLVAAGGGNIVAAGGLNMVAAGAGNMVAAGAGNMVAAGAGNMVAAGAGNMVAAGAGNMVAAGAGNLVAAGGLNYRSPADLLGLGAGTFRLAQAAAPPAYGTQLPAAGMLVWVKSLATGNPVPVGEGPDGKPVWAVFSDAAGRYELHVPAELASTVMVVAEPPFRNDRRTYYAQLAAGQGEDGRIDEDEALVTRYARLSGRTRFDYFLLPFIKDGGLTSPEALKKTFASFAEDGNVDPSVFDLLLTPILEIGAALKANPHVKDDPATPQDDRDEHFRRIVEDMVDVLLADPELFAAIKTSPFELDAYFDRKLKHQANPVVLADPSKLKPEDEALYAAIKANPLYQKIKGEKLPAFVALRLILADVRQAVMAMGPERAKAFAAKNVLIQRANAFHAKYDPPHIPRPYYSFAKPTDLADFLVTEYLAHPINAPYGCRGADCDQAYPRNGGDADEESRRMAQRMAAWTGCHPRQDPLCLPEQGLVQLRTSFIFGYMGAVLQEVGLPATHADLLYAAGESFATATLPAIALKQADLVRVACRYGKGATPACGSP